jgi:Lectin C-type domain
MKIVVLHPFAAATATAALVLTMAASAPGPSKAQQALPKQKKGCMMKHMMMANAGCGGAVKPAPTKKPTTKKPTTPPPPPPPDTESPTASPGGPPSPPPPLPTTCPGVNGTIVFSNDHLYGLVEVRQTWVAAEASAAALSCCSSSGHLVTITSLAEMGIVNAMAEANPETSLWIGLYEKDREWAWVGEDGAVDATLLPDYASEPNLGDAGAVGAYDYNGGIAVYGSAAANLKYDTHWSVVEFEC